MIRAHIMARLAGVAQLVVQGRPGCKRMSLPIAMHEIVVTSQRCASSANDDCSMAHGGYGPGLCRSCALPGCLVPFLHSRTPVAVRLRMLQIDFLT